MFPVLSLVCKSAVRKAAGRLVAFSAILAIAACAPIAGVNTGGPIVGSSGTVAVALLVPSGSGDASDEILATSLQNAARLAMADLGGVKIDLRVYSTASSPAQAQEVARRAVEEGAQVILGPVRAEESNAAAVAVAGSGVNVLSFSNNTAVAGGNLFVLGPTFQNTANRLASYAVRNGVNRIMIVHDRTAAGEAGRAAIQSGAARANGAIVATGSYEFSQDGIVSAVSGIAAQARDSQAQGIFLTADTAGALPLISQLLRDNRVDPAATRFIGLTRWDIPAATLALPALQGGWFALPDPALFAQFRSRYQAAYGEPPHPLSGLAYDGIAAIGALAARGRDSAVTSADLTQGAGFVGVNGIFRLRSDGTNERGLAVAQIQNNQVTVIDPAPRSFGGAGF